MSSSRRRPLLAVLALVLVVVGVVSSLAKTPNSSTLPGGLGAATNAESTALFCTGLSGVVGPFEGHVIFLNTTNSLRLVQVEVVNDLGQRASIKVDVSAHGTQLVSPITLLKGHSFAVEAQVNGGGVVADEVTRTGMAEVPCTTTGVTEWYGAGFDTLVGSSGELSVYNPTATPAVFNVAAYTAAGYSAPAPFQGLSVGAHSQLEVNLGTQIVNATNIGVHVSVLRGAVVIVGVQQSGPVVSLMSGSSALATSMWLPRVTTVTNALAQIRVANPSALEVTVTAHVMLSPYTVAPQSVSVAPYSSGEIIITPNPAIPANGYASVTLTSSDPVFSTLASGTSGGIALWSPQIPGRAFLVSDFSGHGFNSATVTNTSSHVISVRFTTLAQPSLTGSATLAPHSTQNVLSLFSSVSTLSATTLLVSSSSPDLLVTTTLPSTPTGVDVVATLDGR
ncbi:MAG: DUF5719 family protein [Acidimicrobiales bacterium]|jgi:hypothetical protein